MADLLPEDCGYSSSSSRDPGNGKDTEDNTCSVANGTSSSSASGITIQEEKKACHHSVRRARAVKCRPYRYPRHHKNEIKKQVREIINSFIDVEYENYTSWLERFLWSCHLDIDELLDELHGAKFFS
ncbi:hypothetical protein CR513_04941, partial [Mucuna pruriens]